MKLKTLKDLVNDGTIHKGCAWSLKQEAIKWVKKANKDSGMCHTCDEIWNDFFNITPEDLE